MALGVSLTGSTSHIRGIVRETVSAQHYAFLESGKARAAWLCGPVSEGLDVFGVWGRADRDCNAAINTLKSARGMRVERPGDGPSGIAA